MMTRDQRMEWALRLMCTPTVCESFTSGIGSCERNGRRPDAEYTSERWCNSCLAYFALNGGFPARIEGRVA